MKESLRPPDLALAVKDPEVGPQVRVFLVLGVTGSGITTFVQRATGDESLKIGNGLKSRKLIRLLHATDNRKLLGLKCTTYIM